MEEAETLCDRIAIVDKGRKIAEGTLDQLRDMVGEHDVVTMTGAFSDDQVGIAGRECGPDAAVLTADTDRLSLEVE